MLNAAPSSFSRYLRIFGRGLLMVTLVAANTTQIAVGAYGGAFAVGFLISAFWWTNARQSSTNDDLRFGWAAYALGAACGTVTGMALARALH